MSSVHSPSPSRATLITAIPVLPSLDIDRTLSFYVEKLGFDVVVFHDDESAGVQRDRVKIHFWKCDDRRIAEHTSCRIEVEGIDTLYAELLPKGVLHPNGRLEAKPWGFREFAVLDGDGNQLTFAQRLV